MKKYIEGKYAVYIWGDIDNTGNPRIEYNFHPIYEEFDKKSGKTIIYTDRWDFQTKLHDLPAHVYKNYVGIFGKDEMEEIEKKSEIFLKNLFVPIPNKKRKIIGDIQTRAKFNNYMPANYLN